MRLPDISTAPAMWRSLLRPALPSAHRPDAHRQRGGGAAGFLLAALPVILLGLGGVETAHWLLLRQSLSLVLVEAGRAAATRHAEPAALAQAFEQALHVLYPQQQDLEAALTRRRLTLAGIPWQIRILQPVRAAFADHQAITIPGGFNAAPGRPMIRNDYQQAQHQQRLALGWPEGRGPVSGQTIFEANTLTLELAWPHRPLLPGVAAILRLVAGWRGIQDYRQRALAQGYLPVMRGITLEMHSHPMRWPDLGDGRVIHAADPAEGLVPPASGTATCHASWQPGCGSAGNSGSPGSSGTGSAGPYDQAPPPHESTGGAAEPEGGLPAHEGGGSPGAKPHDDGWAGGDPHPVDDQPDGMICDPPL